MPSGAVPFPVVEKKVADEVSGKNKRKDEDNDNPGEDSVPNVAETVFKEMVVTGEIERDTDCTSPSTRVTRSDRAAKCVDHGKGAEIPTKSANQAALCRRSQWYSGYTRRGHVLDRAQHGLCRRLAPAQFSASFL